MRVTRRQVAKIETAMTAPSPVWLEGAKQISSGIAGEAYNVEMGISNELFQTEREENAKCQFKPTPNDTTNPIRAAWMY